MTPEQRGAKMEYLIGQRVIVQREIAIVVKPENNNSGHEAVWCFIPSKGYASAYDPCNVKPLPNGQL